MYAQIRQITAKVGHLEDDRSIARAIRLARIPHLLHSHTDGLSTRQLSELCGVSVRTIQRDLNMLQIDLRLPITQKGDYYSILGDYILLPVSFTLYEAVALYLASRLACRHTDEYNPHVANALYKLSTVLPSYLADKVKSSVETLKHKRANPHMVHVFENLALAWTTHRRAKIRYRSLQSVEAKEWQLEPYFMEMTGIGDSSYVVGHAAREGKEGIITFKLDRIEEIELTDKTYDIPADFDLEKQLAGSWGIIWGEGIDVELKFSPSVTRRVKETIWHPSQVITDLKDGGCLLRLHIGSLLEITPWIRGWGPDVEVLKPKELREQFKIWIKQLNALYD